MSDISKKSIQLMSNSVYFKDCYSNALMQGFNIFGCSSSFMFDNDIYTYSYNNGQILNIDIQLFERKELLRYAGVKVNKHYFQANELKSLLLQNLNGKCFAILGIDDNVSSYRHITVNKSDNYHNILVIDYDKHNDSFLIVDSIYRDIASCEYLHIDSNDLLNCTKGKYQLNQVDFIYPFRKNNAFDDEIYFRRIQHISNIGSSKMCLKTLIEEIDEMIVKKDYYRLEKIFDINQLNQIINRLKIALYYYKEIRPNYRLYECRKSIYDDWYKIRIYILKDSLKSKISLSTVEKVLQLLNHILEIDSVAWDIEKNLRTVIV